MASAAEQQCWICMSDGPGMIAPCRCAGSMKWVHRHCLDRWRGTAGNPHNFTHCRHCDFQYRLVQKRRERTLSEQQREHRRRRVLGRAVRHFILGAGLLQVGLISLAMLIRLVDQQEALVTIFNFTQTQGIPPAGEGSFIDAIHGHKETYYVAACLLSLLVAGVVGTIQFVRAAWREDAGNRRGPQAHSGCGDCSSCCYGCPDCCDCGPTFDGMGGHCDCLRQNCTSVGSGGDSGGECLGACAVCIAVVAIIFVLLGLFFALMALVTWAQQVAERYLQMLELRELAGEYEVQDLASAEVASPAQLESVLQVPTPAQLEMGAGARATQGSGVQQCLLRDLGAVFGLSGQTAMQDAWQPRPSQESPSSSNDTDSSSSSLYSPHSLRRPGSASVDLVA